MKHERVNRFDKLLQIRAPVVLSDVIDRATDRRLQSKSEYIRTAVIDRLKAVGTQRIRGSARLMARSDCGLAGYVVELLDGVDGSMDRRRHVHTGRRWIEWMPELNGRKQRSASMAHKPKRKPKRGQSSNKTPVAAFPPQQPTNPNGVVSCIAPPPDELNTDKADLKHLGGVKSDLWNNHLVNQTIIRRSPGET